MVGWRQLKDALKPAWMLVLAFLNFNLHPHLYPRFAFGTPILSLIALGGVPPPP